MLMTLQKARGELFHLRLRAFPMPSLRLLAAIALSIFLVIVIYLAQSSQAALLNRSIRLKQAQLNDLQRGNAQLRLEIAQLTLPSTLEPRARALGLGPASSVIYADLPNLEVEMADVLPAFETKAPPLRRDLDLAAQITLWWDNVRTQLGILAGSPARAAGPGTNTP